MRNILVVLLSVLLSLPTYAAPVRILDADFLDLGSSAERNFVKYGSAEKGLIGWNQFTGSSLQPTGTGGSALLVWTLDSTYPISGAKSYTMCNNSSASRLYSGVSTTFTVDKKSNLGGGSAVYVSVDYNVISGTYVVGDVIPYLYNVTTSQPVTLFNGQTSGGHYTGNFFADGTSTSYRFILMVSSANTSNYCIDFDNIKVSPQVIMTMPTDLGPVGQIMAFGAATLPPNFIACDGTAISRTTYSELYEIIGTTWGVGDNSTTFSLPDFRGVYLKGAGTTNRAAGKDANGNYYAATLGGYVTDKFQGHIHAQLDPSSAGSANIWGFQFWGGSRSYPLADNSGSSIGLPKTDLTNGTPRTGLTTEPQNAGVTYGIRYTKATGSIITTTQAMNVPVRAQYYDRTAVTIASGATTIIDFKTKTKDTNNAVTTGSAWRFTAPKYGDYTFYISMLPTIQYDAGTQVVVHLFKNGSSFAPLWRYVPAGALASAGYMVTGTKTVTLNKDEYVDFRIENTNTGHNITLDASSYFFVDINEGPDLSVYAVINQNLFAKYNTTAATALAYNAVTELTTIATLVENNNAITYSSGRFTAPASGLYEISGIISTTSVALVAGGQLSLFTFKNGSAYEQIYSSSVYAAFTTSMAASGKGYVRLSAGETAGLGFYQTVRNNADFALNGLGSYNYITFRLAGP